MKKREEQNQLSKVSPRARALYLRLRDTGKFYKSGSKRTPKAMQELVEMGLVGESGRVEVVSLCYVPRHGFKTFKLESWPRG